MELAPPTRFFSLREANALVPTLQQTFARARSLRDALAAVQGELASADHPLPAEGRVEIDPAATPQVQALQRRAQALIDELFGLLREISELGIEVKAADGLVDFRSRLRGRTVYLCWRFGEQGIVHWHELDTGFAGRKPLPEDADFTGDLLH